MKEEKNHLMHLPVLPIVALVFIILKMTGVIDWSWWLVLSPLVFHALALAIIVMALALLSLAGAVFLLSLTMKWIALVATRLLGNGEAR